MTIVPHRRLVTRAVISQSDSKIEFQFTGNSGISKWFFFNPKIILKKVKVGRTKWMCLETLQENLPIFKIKNPQSKVLLLRNMESWKKITIFT